MIIIAQEAFYLFGLLNEIMTRKEQMRKREDFKREILNLKIKERKRCFMNQSPHNNVSSLFSIFKSHSE